jgi:hypothetical protein
MLEAELNFMVFHASKSTSRINVEQTDRTISSIYNEFERILNRLEFKCWSEEIFSFPNLSRSALGPTQPTLQWVLELIPWDKVPVGGFHHSPSTEVENEWSYTSTSPLCLHGLYRTT